MFQMEEIQDFLDRNVLASHRSSHQRNRQRTTARWVNSIPIIAWIRLM